MDSLSQIKNLENQFYLKLYGRVSTVPQSGEDKASLPEQIAWAKNLCLKKGWIYCGEYLEPGITGELDFESREAGSKLLKDAYSEDRDFNIVAAIHSGRVAREPDVGLRLLRLLGYQKIQLYLGNVSTEPVKPSEYEYGQNVSSLYISAFSWVGDKKDNQERKEKHKFGMENRIKNRHLRAGGECIGLLVRFNEKGERIDIPDPIYSPVVQRIFSLYKTGLSFLDITRKFNNEGLKTPKGKEWTTTTIKGILTNPVYYGATVYNKDKTVLINGEKKRIHQPMEKWLIVDEGKHPPAISKQLFWECQELRRSKARFGRTYGESHLLSGLIKCGLCGYSMMKSGGWGGGYYECSRYWKTGKTQCQVNSYRLLYLEQEVFNHIVEVSENPKVLSNLKIQKNDNNLKLLYKQKEGEEKRLNRGKAKREAIFKYFENGDYTSEDFRERKEKQELENTLTENNLKEIDAKIIEVQRNQKVRESALEVLEQFQERFYMLPLKHQKIMLRQLIKNIVIYTHVKPSGKKEKKVEIIFNI